MSATRRVSLAAIGALLLSATGAMATLYAIDHTRRRSIPQEALYVQSPKVLRRMSLGYTGLLADIYWTRAVQYFGAQHHGASGDFRLLAPLLQVTTELDPRLLPAYQFGATFLAPKPPSGAGLPGAALDLMKYGIEHNPDQWRLYYNLGFLYYTEFKDYAKAADAFAQGAKLRLPTNSCLFSRRAWHSTRANSTLPACCGGRPTRAPKNRRFGTMQSNTYWHCKLTKKSRSWKTWSKSTVPRMGDSPPA